MTYTYLLTVLLEADLLRNSGYQNLVDSPMISTSLDRHGWTVEDQKLEIQWMLCQPIPDELVEFINCTAPHGISIVKLYFATFYLRRSNKVQWDSCLAVAKRHPL